MIAQPDVPLAADQSVIWCATLQLAWNETIRLIGEKPRFNREPPEIDLLNQMDFNRSDLAPGSYLAFAGFERNHVENAIRAALEKLFHGAASPELIPPVPENPGPDDFIAYAYLYKNLVFATPFADLPSCQFLGKSIQGFGFDSRSQNPEALNQVAIDDYRSPDDFIIELETKSPDDQLILAKVLPGQTLEATMQTVLERIARAIPQRVSPADKLAVPKLNFDVRKDFTDLEGLQLEPGPNSKIKSRLVLALVQQLVRFQLNEKGAILKSEAVVRMGATAIMLGHSLLFDRPFLVLLKQRTSSRPYFAVWLGDSTLFIPADKASSTSIPNPVAPPAMNAR